MDSTPRHQQVVEAHDGNLALWAALVLLPNSSALDAFFAPTPVRAVPSGTVLLHLLGSGGARVDRDAARCAILFHVFELDDLSVALGLD